MAREKSIFLVNTRPLRCVVYCWRAFAGLLLAVFAPVIQLRAQSYYDPPYAISTYAGSPIVVGGSDGTGPAAQFYSPNGVAIDTSGNTYVADTLSHTIRKVTPAGVVTTLAGTFGSSGSVDGVGVAARFNAPRGVAVDGAGNLYVADTGNHCIRKITPDGTVTTLCGQAGSPGSSDGTGSTARFKSPYGITVTAAGDTIYIADSSNHEIRMITAAGSVTTYAGTGSPGSSDGTGTAAGFNFPRAIVVDGLGYVYVADTSNGTIRKIAPGGVVTTLAGTAGLTGSADGNGSAARFNRPLGIAVTNAGDAVYVGDTSNHTVRKITSSGDVTTLAGLALSYGSADGSGSAARFYFPNGVAVDSGGNLAVSDSSNSTIRWVTVSGDVTTLAGTPVYGSTDGTGAAARFHSPQGMGADAAGNVYVADNANQIIRKIAPGGVVTTLAGMPGTVGTADGTGSAARFNSPTGLAVDLSGNIYVTDNGRTIRKITPAGEVTTLAGNASVSGSADGTGTAAQFRSPAGIAVDAAGNLYVADQGNYTIRKVTSAGVVTTLAGTAGTSGSVDGTGSAALFGNPTGVAIDPSGNVFVTDAFNRVIRKITPAGVVTKFAGSPWTFGGTNDGTGLQAQFNTPWAIAADAAGNLYVADQISQTIRRIRPDGLVSTLAGFTGSSGTTDGAGQEARFYGPYGLTVDGAGNLYVSDSVNCTIRKGIEVAGEVPYAFSTLAGNSIGYGYADGTGSAARFNRGSGITSDAAGNVYVADNNAIRKVTPAGVVTTLAGNPAAFPGFADGTGSAALFNGPTGLVLDATGNLYVTDTTNRVIRKVTPAGVVTTIAGSPGVFGTTDGTGNGALFGGPKGIVFDSQGNLLVTDGNAVRRVTTDGVVTTVAGSVQYGGYLDGTGAAARFNFPQAIAVDSEESIYVADESNYVIRKITAGGVVTTFAGNEGAGSGSTDGTGAAARFGFVSGIAIDGADNLYVLDGNSTVRRISPAAVTTTLAGIANTWGTSDGMETVAQFYLPRGIAVDASANNIYVFDTDNFTIRRGTRVTDPYPFIIHQPVDQMIIPGQQFAYFAAGARGLPSPSLQWQRLPAAGGGWSALSESSTYVGVGTPQLTVQNTTLAMRGDQFRCVASNSVGSVASNVATLDVNSSPGFSQQPADQTVLSGTPTTFLVVATGDRAPTLQWQVKTSFQAQWADVANDGVYSGVTTATLTIGSPTVEMSGYQFRCIATNPANIVPSYYSTLTVNEAPAFASQPASQMRGAGYATFVSFAVVVSGNPAPALQWQRLPAGSGTWANLPFSGPYSWYGPSGNTLQIYGISVSMNGDQFRCVATNSVNSVTSDPATLTVTGVNTATDFSGDGKADFIWQNSTTGDRGFWLMNGTGYASWVDLGAVGTDWRIAATADFNGDGKPDFLWENTATGDRGFWLMNGTAYASWVSMGWVSTDWRIAAAADFDGDGKPDILWENTVTGVRGFWLMNGTAYASWVNLGAVSTDWRFVAAADFNNDGKTDILMENTVTGDRGFWLMNGTTFASWVDMGYVSTDWHIAAAADYNGDGKPDILWENTVTGDRGFWLMNGTAFSSWIDLGYVSTDWRLAN